MRIALVSAQANPLGGLGSPGFSGQGVYVAELSRALAARGHRVTVYTRKDGPDLPERVVVRQGCVVVYVPAGPPRLLYRGELAPHLGEFSRFLAAEWGRRGPDLAHTHFWLSGLATLLATRPLGVPVVQTYHGFGPGDRGRIERMIGRAAARVLATCADEVPDLIRMGVGRDRISVAPGGVDLTAFRPDGPVAERTARYRLVSVGPLAEPSGFEQIIRILRMLRDAELLIAGGGTVDPVTDDPEARRLLRVAESNGVGDRVRLLGRVPRTELPALLRSADVVVCSPESEPLGLVPLEAMACGTPVVATAVGGLADTVVDGLTGVLVPAGRTGALCRAVASLLTDRIRRAAMGNAGRDRVDSRYSWDRVAGEAARVYQRVLR
ncbi:MAG TPA: glycosyltransferase [Pseudonocardiaceae bacterium]|jgi:glycosyltransferase involved in cell wall biosynthesis|nr:glycosyltransferase [Pseudonocardiaceae bacterium]